MFDFFALGLFALKFHVQIQGPEVCASFPEAVCGAGSGG